MINEFQKRLLESVAINESVGQTIFKQLKMIDHWAVASWGAGSPKRLAVFNNEDQIIGGLYKLSKYFPNIEGSKLGAAASRTRGGLIMKVNMPKLKNGYVIISLSGADLYDIYFGTIRKGIWKEKTSLKNVYAEDLVTAIEGKLS
jgi:hypothetical protein